MKPTCKSMPGPGEREREQGFSLVEVMIALVVAVIIAAGVYSLLISGVRTTESQKLKSERNQQAQSAMDFMIRELNMLGYSIPFAPAATPNDDGYPSYGDYGPNDAGPKVVRASANEIVFSYMDLSTDVGQTDGGTAAPGLQQHRLVRYSLAGEELVRQTWRWNINDPLNKQWQLQSTETIADSVDSLGFSYYGSDGAVISAVNDLTYSERSDVRRVKVSVAAQQAREDPLTGTQQKYTLETEVALVNMGVITVEDTTPPPAPAITALLPVNICGVLDVHWTPTPVAADLVGYLIQVNSGGTIVQYKAPPTASSARLGGLSSYVDPATGAVIYSYSIAHDVPASVTVYSYDASGNVSAASNTVNATPTADAPGQPQGVDASADMVNGEFVDLAWTDNSEVYNQCGIGETACDTDVVGYRVFKRVYGTTDWTMIADESTVSQPSFHDTIPPQEKCRIYDYKVQAVNRCDSTLISLDSAVVYGDGSSNTITNDSPTPGTTNTRPADATPPAAPTGPGAGGTVLSKAGFRRNFINWHNPADDDLSHVTFRYNSAVGGEPPYPATIVDGTGIEDYPNGRVDSSSLPGFAPAAMGLGVVHTGTDVGIPALDDNSTYAYSLFAVDLCDNVSPPALTAQTTVNQCGEEVTGPTAGAARWNPSLWGSDTAAQLAVTGGTDSYHFSWNRIDDSADGIWDLAGYYVFTNEGAGSWDPSSGYRGTRESNLIVNPPSGQVSWSGFDSGAFPSADDNPGYMAKVFKSYAIPIDCNRETNLGSDPWAFVIEAMNPPPLNSNILTLAPGRVTFTNPDPPLGGFPLPADPFVVAGELTIGSSPTYTPSSATNFFHNTVKLYLYNTSARPVELNSFQISWEDPAVFLTGVRRVDSNACLLGSCTTPNSSPVNIAPNTVIDGTSGTPYLEVELVFTDFGGVVTSDQDMRFTTLDVSDLSYTKFFEDESSPVTVTSYMPNPRNYDFADDNITVPLGPVAVASQESYGAGNFFVPSRTPGNHNIASTNDVNVEFKVTDSTGVGLDKVVLYYAAESQKEVLPPQDLSKYTAIPMLLITADGVSSTYAIYDEATSAGSKIPGSKDKRIWYFVLAQDLQGNWDRDPEIGDSVNAYTYDQDNPCLNTPNPVTSLTAGPHPTGGGPDILIEWIAPTMNTDGSAINDMAGFIVEESTDGTTFAEIADVSGKLAGGAYSYEVKSPPVGIYYYQVTVYDECPLAPVKSPPAGPIIENTDDW